MEDYRITDEQFDRSSKYSKSREAHNARLNFHYSWRPYTESGCWIQVDLITMYSITGLITQGEGSKSHWVTTYQVQYQTTSESSLEYVKDGDNVDEVRPRKKVFDWRKRRKKETKKFVFTFFPCDVCVRRWISPLVSTALFSIIFKHPTRYQFSRTSDKVAF